MKQRKGFTLLELLIVIGVVAIIAAIILIIINPLERIREARDNQRLQEINALAEAIRLYKIDNNGRMLCQGAGENGIIGIGRLIDRRLARYFTKIPKDPSYDPANPYQYSYYLDNRLCCVSTVNGHQVDNCERGALFINGFESQKYKSQYSNYSTFCPAGSRYAGESKGYTSEPFAYAISFYPGCL